MMLKMLKEIYCLPHIQHQHHTHSILLLHLCHRYSPTHNICHLRVLDLKAFCKNCQYYDVSESF